MWFCPLDGTLLTLGVHTEDETTATSAFVCTTCPYTCPIQRKGSLKITTAMPRKVVDDILGGAAAWENVDRTMTSGGCPSCSHKEAYFMQIQIRSAVRRVMITKREFMVSRGPPFLLS